MLRHSKSVMSMTFMCFSIAKLECQKSLGISFLSLICPCMICLNKEMQRKWKAKRSKSTLKMIASVYSRRYENYRMYLEGDSPHQTIMIVCELKWFFHISNHHNMHTFFHILNYHNMYTLMQSCDVFYTKHAIFFTTLDTCASTMWFGHHKVLHMLIYAH